MISIIIPTYNEVDNLEFLVSKIDRIFEEEDIDYEIILVDDNSPDNTAQLAYKLSESYPVRVNVRKKDRGLSKSVVKGFEMAKGDICVVMDADLSHPVEKIPNMVRPILENRCDATVGSRYIPGGGFKSLPFHRKITSRMAGYMARGITSLSDPTSGFMAIRKSIIDQIDIDPLGWKIVLEVVVKAELRIMEIPTMFSERKKGKSKLGIKAQLEYIHQLLKLYYLKYQYKLLSAKKKNIGQDFSRH